MSVVNIGGGGLGSTTVLGVRVVRGAIGGLALTGMAGAKILVLAATGVASTAAGLVLRGRGRRVQAGVPLEEGRQRR